MFFFSFIFVVFCIQRFKLHFSLQIEFGRFLYFEFCVSLDAFGKHDYSKDRNCELFFIKEIAFLLIRIGSVSSLFFWILANMLISDTNTHGSDLHETFHLQHKLSYPTHIEKKNIEAINNQTNKWGCFGAIKKSPDDGKEAISRKSPGLT